MVSGAKGIGGKSSKIPMQASLQEDFELEIRKCTENQTFLYPEKQTALRSSELRL